MYLDHKGHTDAVLIDIHPCICASGYVLAICACISLYLQEGIGCADSIKASVCPCYSQPCQVYFLSWPCIVNLDCWDYPESFRSPWSLHFLKPAWSFCSLLQCQFSAQCWHCQVSVLLRKDPFWSCWIDSGRLDLLRF